MAENKRIFEVKKWVMRLSISEKKERLYLKEIDLSFEDGNLKKFLKNIKKAKRLIRRREKRTTYWLIDAAKKANINGYGRLIDIFEKQLLAKHKRLYDLLERMVIDGQPNNAELSQLIPQAEELEKGIIEDVRGLTRELEKQEG